MKIALGTVDLDDNELRAISLSINQAVAHETLPKLPPPASRDTARNWLRAHGWIDLGAAVLDLEYLKKRINSQQSWRRGQPELKR